MKKPSQIKSVRGKIAHLLPSHFRAITLFGTVYCQSEFDVKNINATEEIDTPFKNHETIHVRQAEGMSDSWFKFYLRYIWQTICNLPLIFVNFYAPYKFMPLEMEAYANENDLDYCYHGAVNGWRVYQKYSLKQRYKLAKEYYKKRSTTLITKFMANIK